jgi:hypothetical protein
MIRLLVVIRSEWLISRDVQVNLAYRCFCKLGIDDTVPDHSAFSRARIERFRDGDVSPWASAFENRAKKVSWAPNHTTSADSAKSIKRNAKLEGHDV